MNFKFWKKSNPPKLDESNEAFKNKVKHDKQNSGEGYEELSLGVGMNSLSSFNTFYSKYINASHKNEIEKIKKYREMAQMPEIADVIEDAVIESMQEDNEGNVINIEIQNEELSKNENIVKTINEEFDSLFKNRLKIEKTLWNGLLGYYTDGRDYYEVVIGNPKNKGIIKLKKLPSESMDFDYDEHGRFTAFYQYLTPNAPKPENLEDAEKRMDVIGFYPQQIVFIHTGVYGNSRKNIIGYLEKCTQAYNQLKMLETSLIIYRIVRSPERLVFRIDTGNMPKDKAMRYVDKVARKFKQKQSYDPDTGQLESTTAITSILENYFIGQCIRLNTDIPLLSGETKKLYEIIDDYNNGIKNYTYSIDQKTKKIVPGEIEWAGVTRKNAEMIRVWLDNNEYIDCTPDHKFVLRNGKEREAQYLKTNDSLMPLYRKLEKINKNTNEYEQIYDLKTNDWKFTHRIMGPSPSTNKAIHHKDFNRFNNCPDNLCSLSIKEHIKVHCQNNDKLWTDEFKEKMSFLMKENWNNKEFRDKSIKNMKIAWDNDERKLKQSKSMKDKWANDDLFIKNALINNRKPKSKKSVEKMKKSLKEMYMTKKGVQLRKKIGLQSKNRWEDKNYRKEMSDIQSVIIDELVVNSVYSIILKNNFPSLPILFNKLSMDKSLINHWNNINKDKRINNKTIGKHSLYKIFNKMGFNDYTELKNNIVINHKVKKVEKLNFKEDTGCLTIKDPGNNHNFAVSAGVFIKNSADGRGSSIETIGGNPGAFSEMDDIFYFRDKLYRSLKYPRSRVEKMNENQNSDILFAGGNMGEIQRDEIKWAKFLERQQSVFCESLKDLFLLHLEFTGTKKEIGINSDDIEIKMNPPNQYKEQLNQLSLRNRMDNYSNLSNNEEMPKSYLMNAYLKMDMEEIEELKEWFDIDKKIFPKDEGF